MKTKIALLALGIVITPLFCIGCGSSGSASSEGTQTVTLSGGQKLYRPDGQEFGTIVGGSQAHQFPNGDVEPGVMVDYGPRIPGTPPQWIPARSAAKMAR
jgi:hypothetical protein